MAITPTEFAQKMAGLSQLLRSSAVENTLLMAKESLALIRLRIQNTGIDADGASLGVYSVAYEKRREFFNLRTDIVDLTATGGMWRETDVDLVGTEDGIVVAIARGQTDRAKDLLEFNSERYGDLLRLSPQETDFVVTAFLERRRRTIIQFLQ
jgi:hypothetical protein